MKLNTTVIGAVLVTTALAGCGPSNSASSHSSAAAGTSTTAQTSSAASTATSTSAAAQTPSSTTDPSSDAPSVATSTVTVTASQSVAQSQASTASAATASAQATGTMTAKQVADKLGCTGFTADQPDDMSKQVVGVVEAGDCRFDGHKVSIATFKSHESMVAGLKVISGFMQMGGSSSSGTDEYLDVGSNWAVGTDDGVSSGQTVAVDAQKRLGGQVVNVKDVGSLS